MLTASPIRTPISRSVRTMATTVTANGTNWYRPSSHICFTSAGLASLTPVTSRIAARQDSGIRFSQAGRNSDADQQQDAVDDRRRASSGRRR